MARWNLYFDRDDQKYQILYGWDRQIGFFCSVFVNQVRLIEYDNLQPGYNHLAGFLAVLTSSGVFSIETVQESVQLLPIIDCLQDIEDLETRRVAEIISNLKKAASA